MNRPSRYLANVTRLTFARIVVVAFIACLCQYATLSEGKVFERCELAQLLRYGHGLDVIDVANWVCIAQHSSSLNTSAFGGNAKSGSHGLFQISDQYWCSPPGKGVACGLACDRLRDDDIGDDLQCARVIYAEHQRLSGDGYTAWIAYTSFCRDNPYEYVEDCFGNEEREFLHSKSITANSVEDDEEDDYEVYSKKRGKVYGRCELAKELFLKHKMPMEDIPTWVCIAQHESNYDTSAVGRLNADGSADHGLFQISDLYWCSHKGGRRKACGLSCSKLLDADITDDVKCVKQIHEEHTRISGNGFTAWTVYNLHCHGSTESYIRGCFDGIDVNEPSLTSVDYRKPSKPSKVGKQKPHGKVYEPCELAEELRSKHHLPEDQIATWVCIAKHESDYNTSAIGYGDHGLFQISDIYWCSPPGKGWACGLSCSDLEDSDISDDVECIRKIHAEHTRLSGDGFNAWTVYPHYCSEGRSEKYIAHCPGGRPVPAVTSPSYTKKISDNSIEDYEPKRGKVYGRCELAKELHTKHHMPMDEIPTWVCIAHHESNFDTSAVGRLNADGSADHGLFQISDLFWCSHNDRHKACGLSCSKLLDNDIADDIRCVKQIYNEHTRISGDGFTAWTVYDAYCRERTEQYVRGCFDGSASEEDFHPLQRTTDFGYKSKNKPKGKVYEECELAKELRDKYRIPKDQISTWICIAKHQSGLNTSSAVSNVHGMFHISDEYWCSPPGKGKVCELNCADLEDSDISDDLECVQKIYLEHQRLFGNGFSAWVVYPQHCSNGRADDYVGHCPGFTSTRGSAFSFGNQQGVIKTHPKLGGQSIEIPNKPVFSHEFSLNPFLKHVEQVSSYTPTKTYSAPSEESFSASQEVDDVVSANHEFSLNPFLKHVSLDNKASVLPIVTTASKTAFSGFPISPTPITSIRLPTYQPQNEEKGKVDAFKSFITPALQSSTQTPRIDRLQTYQLNTFKSSNSFVAPSLSNPTAQPITSNRLQPYKPSPLNAFNTFATSSLSTSTSQLPATNRLQPYQLNTFGSSTVLGTPVLPALTTRAPSTNRLQPYQLNTFNTFKSSATPSLTVQTSTTTKQLPPIQLSPFSSIKSIATPSLPPLTTNEKTVSRLQSAPLNTFSSAKNVVAPSVLSLTAQVQSTNRLQPLSSSIATPSLANGFTSLKTGVTPTASPFKPLVIPPLPSLPLHSATSPFAISSSTIRTPLTLVPKDSGRYDSGKYDSGRYDAGKYDPGRYDAGRYTPSTSKAVTYTTSRPETKSAVQNSGQYSVATPTLLSNSPTSIRIASTSQGFGKPIIPFTQKLQQPLNTRLPSISTNPGRYEVNKTPTFTNSLSSNIAPTSTTSLKFDPFKTAKQSTSSKVPPTPSISLKFDPFKTFSSSTLKPFSFSATTKKFEGYNAGKYTPYKSVNLGQYTPQRTLATPSLPTKSSGLIKAATPTAKFDPFKPFGANTVSYDPFEVFNTQKQSSPFSFLSGKTTSGNELDFEPSLNSKRETSSATGGRTSASSNRETKVSGTSTIAKPSLTITKSSLLSLPMTTKKSKTTQQVKATLAQTQKSVPSKTVAVPTIKISTTTAGRPQIIPTTTRRVTTIPARSAFTSSSQKSVSPKPITTRSVTTPTRSVSTSSTTRPFSTIKTKPLVPFSSQLKATSTGILSRSTRSTDSSKATSSATQQLLAKPSVKSELGTIKTKTSSTRSSSSPRVPNFTVVPDKTSKIKSKATSTKVFDQYSRTRSVITSRTTIKPTATFTTPAASIRTQSQKSLNPTKVGSSQTRSPTRSTTTRSPITTVISPTKSHRSSESLFSTSLNIYDLYFKLYGIYPPHRTSPGVQQVSKTSQFNVVPSRVS